MKLLFKQQFFSWFDSYDIFDEEGNTVFTVKGEENALYALMVALSIDAEKCSRD